LVDDTEVAVENEDQEFSLADIAQLDASDIAEVRFESLPAGVFVFRGESAAFEDTTNRDDERRIVLAVKMEVAEVKSVIDRDYKTDEQKATLIGKKHTEKFYVVPEKAAEGLGLIRAFIGDIGLPNEGPFGGVEGSEPGIVDGFVGHEFTGKIVQRPRKGDPTVKDSSLRIDKPKTK
jgi:hypothetical protein